MIPELLLTCAVLLSPDYIHEWDRAKKAVGWKQRLDLPEMVLACPYILVEPRPGPNFGKRMLGTTFWEPYLTKRGKMRVSENVVLFVPEGGADFRTTLVHEFIHVLLMRWQHVLDPRGFVGNQEEYICEVYPEGCGG